MLASYRLRIMASNRNNNVSAMDELDSDNMDDLFLGTGDDANNTIDGLGIELENGIGELLSSTRLGA